VRAAHIEFVATLAGNLPNAICADVDDLDDLDGRADHLEKVFAPLHVYSTAIISDTAHPGATLNRRYLDRLFQHLSADALRVIRSAVDETRERKNWRAS
jgi:hypothetical protein